METKEISKIDVLIISYKTILNILKPKIKEYVIKYPDDEEGKKLAKDLLTVTSGQLVLLFTNLSRDDIIKRIKDKMKKYREFITDDDEKKVLNIINKMCDLFA